MCRRISRAVPREIGGRAGTPTAHCALRCVPPRGRVKSAGVGPMHRGVIHAAPCTQQGLGEARATGRSGCVHEIVRSAGGCAEFAARDHWASADAGRVHGSGRGGAGVAKRGAVRGSGVVAGRRREVPGELRVDADGGFAQARSERLSLRRLEIERDRLQPVEQAGLPTRPRTKAAQSRKQRLYNDAQVRGQFSCVPVEAA